MWFTSRTFPYGAVAPLNTPLSRIVALPCVLVEGLLQPIVLGFDAWTRVDTSNVGLLFCGLPLNSNTQPLIWNAPLAVAVACPIPTLALPQTVIACFMVLPTSCVDEHLSAAFGLIFQFLSRKSWVRSTAPPGTLLPGFV